MEIMKGALLVGKAVEAADVEKCPVSVVRRMITRIVREYLKYCPIADIAPDGSEPGLRGCTEMQAQAMAFYETSTRPSPLEVQMAGDLEARWGAELERRAIERLGGEV